jgi:hydrogenase expression/formation protein HypE
MSAERIAAGGLICPTPLGTVDRVQLGHGSGGKLTAALLKEHFLPHFTDEHLAQLGDAAVVPVSKGEIAVSTDTFVVRPLEFPGGNIGSLAVHGTVNDLAMMGATPAYLSAGFVLEEGLPFDTLDRIVQEMARAARAARVRLITGDTKVVERGKADGVFVNTTGIGFLDPTLRPAPGRARSGDDVVVSGPIGRHGIAIMAAREGLAFDVELESDSAALHPLVERLRDAAGAEVHVLRDPTRGGMASALNEIAAASGVGVELEEWALPIPEPVAAACEMLGFDPLYVANEGILIAFVSPEGSSSAFDALRSHPLGAGASIIDRDWGKQGRGHAAWRPAAQDLLTPTLQPES